MIETLLKQVAAGRRSPATEERLQAAQQRLGMRFPQGLVEFYSASDGLVVQERFLVLNDLATGTDYAEAIADLDIAHSLGLFPLSESDDSNPYCVACKPPLFGRIIHLRHDDAPRLAFRDLDGFAGAIASVVPLGKSIIIDHIELGYAADHSDRTPDDDVAGEQLLAGDCPDVDNVYSIATSLFSSSRADAVIPLLEHESMWVREDAAEELGLMGNVAAIEALHRLASIGDRQDNRAARRALELLKGTKYGK